MLKRTYGGEEGGEWGGRIIDGPVAALLSSGHALSVAIGNPDRVPYHPRLESDRAVGPTDPGAPRAEQ